MGQVIIPIELTSDEWGQVKSQFVTSPKGGGKVKLPTAFKELTQAVYQFVKAKTDKQRVKIFENSTQIMADLLDNELTVSPHETSFKIKLPFFEISRKITRVKK